MTIFLPADLQISICCTDRTSSIRSMGRASCIYTSKNTAKISLYIAYFCHTWNISEHQPPPHSYYYYVRINCHATQFPLSPPFRRCLLTMVLPPPTGWVNLRIFLMNFFALPPALTALFTPSPDVAIFPSLCLIVVSLVYCWAMCHCCPPSSMPPTNTCDFCLPRHNLIDVFASSSLYLLHFHQLIVVHHFC